MPRHCSQTSEEIAAKALIRFWAFGYGATSMDDLVAATGASRHTIYALFEGKRGLFLATFPVYRDRVVDPAFSRVERAGATFADIASYWNQQIEAADRSGLPGPGCLIANTATEVAPHDAEIAEIVRTHRERIASGFRRVLQTSWPDMPGPRTRALAEALVVFSDGLWSAARLTNAAEPLRRAADEMFFTVRESMR